MVHGVLHKSWLLLLTVWVTWQSSSWAREIVGSRGDAVAIIGAGIGGSAAAYYLRQELGNDTSIDVFEQERVGGRTQVFRLPEKTVEIGASIIHEQNQHFRELADAMGLKRVEPGMGSREARLGIFDGSSFVFSQSSWSFITLFRMVRRYGLAYFRFQAAPKALLKKFKRIYQLQSEGRAFNDPEALLQQLELYEMTQRNMRTELETVLGKGRWASRFAKEFVGGINHINYNQDNRLNAFAGMVSMLPTVDGRLFAIEGGNFQLAVKLLAASQARVQQPKQLSTIERANGSYYLRSQGSRDGPYAAVIVATPLEGSGLTLEGLEKQPNIPPRAFQTTVTTVVSGRLKADYFNVTQLPGEYVMVAEDAGVPFSVIAPLSRLENGTRLYKLFSEAVLTQQEVAALFSDGRVLLSHPWKAYPRFNPPERFAPFVLAEGLFYSNAIETAASAMEMSAIAAKNSALLVKHFLAGGISPSHTQQATSAATAEL